MVRAAAEETKGLGGSTTEEIKESNREDDEDDSNRDTEVSDVGLAQFGVGASRHECNTEKQML